MEVHMKIYGGQRLCIPLQLKLVEGVGIEGSWTSWYLNQEMNSGPMQEQKAPLTTKPPLQAQIFILSSN